MRYLSGLFVCWFTFFLRFSTLQSGQIPYPDFEVSMLRGDAVKGGYSPLKKNYMNMDVQLVRFFKENYEKNSTLINEGKKDRIPRIVHQIWLGGQVPDKYRDWMEGWAALKGWTYKLWTDKDVDSLFLYNRDIYERSKNKGEKSDILRLEILYQFGGLYVDVDYECINKDIFEEAHRNYDFYIGFESLEHGVIVTKNRSNMFKICNALIGSIPHHPLIKHLIVNMKANFLAYYPFNGALERSGPSYMTRVICEYVLSCPDKKRNMYMPCTFFYPFTEKDLIESNDLRCLPETAGIHYWSGSWRTRNWKNIEDDNDSRDQEKSTNLNLSKYDCIEYLANGYEQVLDQEEVTVEYIPNGYQEEIFLDNENLEYLPDGYREITSEVRVVNE